MISTHRPMGTPRARWWAPARSPPWFYGRACKTMLKGVSVARLTLWKPPAPITSRTRASPACAGRRTDRLRQRGRHADPHRTRVIKRPVIFHTRGATCWHPQVRGVTTMGNSMYNGWRMEDVWLDK